MSAPREIPFARPLLGRAEREALLQVLEGPILTHGSRCRGFEESFALFLGEEVHCQAVSSCMGALHLAALELGLGPGMEVIVPAMTHVATVHAVEISGARPVFADCDPATGNLDPALLSELVSPRTRAIFLVHFLGIPAEMDAIVSFARERGLEVVEDCALALGSRYQGRHAGLWGRAGCFSFYPAKHITTGEGGMYVSRHAEAAERVGHLKGFGVDRTHQERRVPGLYDVTGLGLNYRMSELQAALGLVQMERLPAWLEQREQNFRRLAAALADLPGITILDSAGPEQESSHYCLGVLLPSWARGRRARLIAGLQRAGVGTSIYYPHPVPRLAYYRERYGYRPGSLPGAEALADGSLALPVGPHLGRDDMDYLAEVFRDLWREVLESAD